MSKATRTERGWAGHFICSERCLFRRNTLLECGDKRIVVSTVGAMRALNGEGIETIGAFGRYYETMAFEAMFNGVYWEADVGAQLEFKSEWAICAESVEDLLEEVDNLADEMHEDVVAEFIKRLEK